MAPADQASVLRDRTDTRAVTNIGHVEGLDAAVVQNTPHLDHTLRISGYETVQRWLTVNSDQGRFMPDELLDLLRHIWVPHVYVEVKAT